jgi:hypothetical protein
MKKVFVLAITFILGLGLAAFAGPLSGSWSTSLGIDPGGPTFESLTSTLAVDYTMGGWTFGSSSTFSLSGFSSQSFTAAGTLGAFSLSSTMNFNPMAVTEKDYTAFWAGVTFPTTQTASLCPITYTTTTEPKFTTWKTEGSVSIAGVEFGGLFYLDQSNWDVTLTNYVTKLQTDSQATAYDCTSKYNGAGWRFMAAGSMGDATVTSYTYFNLKEKDASTKYCPAVGKSGTFSIASAGCCGGCGAGFYEEYIMVEGLSIGCATFDAALSVLCSGFADLTFVTKDVMICGWLDLDFGITFTTTTKTVDFCSSFVCAGAECFTVELGIGSPTYETGSFIDGIYLHGFGFSATWNGITFSSYTELDEYSALFSADDDWTYLYNDTVYSYLIPYAGRSDACTDTAAYFDADGEDVYYELQCVETERYKLWEKFVIGVDSDSCCGGALALTVSTYFGDNQVLDYVAYDIISAGSLSPGSLVYLYGTTGASATDALDAAEVYDTVTFKTGYAAGAETTLFNWAETDVDASIGVGSNITLDLGFDISAFGWEELDFGFTFTF